jgi:periplasmic protein TonB
MTDALSHWSSKAIDSSWWQLPLVTLASLLVWSVLLLAFGLYLAHMHPAAPPVDAIQASIIEVSGLAGGGGGSPGVGRTGSSPPARAQPTRRVETHAAVLAAPRASHKIIHRPRYETFAKTAITHPRESMQPPSSITNGKLAKVASLSGTGKSGAAMAGTGISGIGGGGGTGNGVGSGSGAGVGPGSGNGHGGGFGNGGNGPQAIYAPVPTIPEDLRDEVFEAKAVVLFHVSRDGRATVSLVSPTEFDELNDLILDTLKKWRFRPAFKGGVAIDSAAQVRLLITVQ